MKSRKFLGGINRFKLILTLGLAVLLPAAALIVVNFLQLRSFERNKVVEAAIHRDFQEMLAISEKQMNKKIYAKLEDTMALFPSPDADEVEQQRKLDEVLSKCSCFSHAFLVSEGSFVFQTQSGMNSDKYLKEEHEKMAESFHMWLSSKEESKSLIEMMNKMPHHMYFSPAQTKRADGPGYLLTALFALPQGDGDQIVIGGLSFDPCYLKNNFFPEMLADAVQKRTAEQSGNNIAMMIYPTNTPEGKEIKPIAATTGWGEGKAEVSRKFEDVFRGLGLGIKYQGTSVQQLGETWMRRNFLILGILSALIIIGLVLTKHVVSKEMALAKLKSDFVSNVSHELRTPLALIRLYAETLELGRITTSEKKQQYYRIVRKESERLTALINNILDFSRIEAGRKEYEFRETNIAELVHNTLDSYRYQIEQQGFEFQENIEPDVPPVRVDREAIARALVNLVNNALKYSVEEKYLGVKLYRENGQVKLEVADHGIGIARRDQSKIFEKFYRAGDPLVHNTKGSGLGLSLVRHISEAHGGDIVVESTPGKGSKFVLSLPLNPAPQQMANA